MFSSLLSGCTHHTSSPEKPWISAAALVGLHSKMRATWQLYLFCVYLSIYLSVCLSACQPVWNTHNSLPVSSPTWRKRRRRRSSSTRTEWDLDHFYVCEQQKILDKMYLLLAWVWWKAREFGNGFSVCLGIFLGWVVVVVVVSLFLCFLSLVVCWFCKG